MFSAVLVLSGVAATAATISNRDDKEQKITIIEGEAKTDRVLKPQEVAEKICSKGCVIRLNDNEDDEYQLDPEDVVSIEDGYMYHDSPDAPQNAPTTTAPSTQAPVKQ